MKFGRFSPESTVGMDSYAVVLITLLLLLATTTNYAILKKIA